MRCSRREVKNEALQRLLLCPDYLAHTYGETYYAWVWAKGPKSAVKRAQRQAFGAHGSESVQDAADFACLLVIEGHHESLRGGTNK